MSDVNDIGRINYVLQNYDSAQLTGTTRAYSYRAPVSGKTKGARTIKLSMAIDGTVHVVEAVTNAKTNKVHVLSSFYEKNATVDTVATSDAPEALDAGKQPTPQQTSETVVQSASDKDSVQQSDADYNSENGQNRNDVRFSLTDIEEHDSETERLIRENNDLGEALQAANTLIDIMRKRPDGLPAAPSAASIDRLARKIKDETGTKVSLKNLRENLDKTFTVMLNAERSRVRRFRKLIF